MRSEAPGPASGAAPYVWVASLEALARTLDALAAEARIAIDIEADSLYHYFEKVCLIQVSTPSETYVIDPLALKDLSRLGPILADRRIEKVFHAAGYDIFCLRRDYGFTFANLFDTHLAGQLLGYEQLGLTALLEKLLAIAHSKGMQRDDWSRRPLEPAQLEYAAMDTRHLLELRDLLEAQLIEKGRLEWAREEFELAALAELPERQFDPEGFRRIKGTRELSLRELSVVRSLYLLRDGRARELDLPPFKVMNNSVLIDLARKPPQSAAALANRPGISRRLARECAGEIYRAIVEARASDPSFLIRPRRPQFKAPGPEVKQRVERLKGWRAEKARELALPPGVVFPGTMLEAVAASPPSNLATLESMEGMRRWRARLFGPEILEVVATAS